MAKKGKSRYYIHKLRSKYRLIIYNDKTYAEVWQMRLSRLNVLTFFGVIAIAVVIAVVSLIAFTPLRELIPGYPDSNTRRNIVQNVLRLDSLEQSVQRWVLYNDNLNRILSGKQPVDIEGVSDTTLARRYHAIMLSHSIEDSIFRHQVEEMEQFNLAVSSSAEQPQTLANLHFFAPLRGKIISSFSPQENRFGTGLSATTGSTVMAALDGTIMAEYWTIEHGYVVHIQHSLNIATVYKNNGALLKKVGQHVNAGEAIGIISATKGTTGDFEFEIWSNGTPIDPEQYIVF